VIETLNATTSQPPPPSVPFAGGAKASDVRACLELTTWYTQELTLTGHG